MRLLFLFLVLGSIMISCNQSGSIPALQQIHRELVVDNPAFQACHASTIVSLDSNRLMAAWFAGPHEGDKDVVILGATRESGKWTRPVELANGIIDDTLRYACWNPVLFKNKTGELALFYKVGPNPREWWGEMKISKDGGRNWSAAKRLPEGMLGPIKNKPWQLKDGSILYPSSTESLDEKTWHIHLEKSDITFENWTKISINNDSFGVIQPSILHYPNGDLQLLSRSRQNYIVQCWSKDNGQTWGPLSKTSLPNPNAGSDAVTLKNGWQLLVYNPMPAGKEWWNGRNKLEVALSKDGHNWETLTVLENEPDGEYSYPAVIQDERGLIHITYTYNRKNIRYVTMILEP
jgi:predicted neuraminidase